jgi:hypothetical protein
MPQATSRGDSKVVLRSCSSASLCPRRSGLACCVTTGSRSRRVPAQPPGYTPVKQAKRGGRESARGQQVGRELGRWQRDRTHLVQTGVQTEPANRPSHCLTRTCNKRTRFFGSLCPGSNPGRVASNARLTSIRTCEPCLFTGRPPKSKPVGQWWANRRQIGWKPLRRPSLADRASRGRNA